jgi:L-lactate utilization protein LutB
MVTQEIGVVEALRTSGVTAYQTDFAELIIQLAHNRPRDWAPGTQLHSLRGLPQRVPGHERTGGHAYGATYPGPIGAILTPLMAGVTFKTAAAAMSGRRRWIAAVKSARLIRLIRHTAPPPLSHWTSTRDLPDPPKMPFRDWWSKR